jgi:hypothetical protein
MERAGVPNVLATRVYSYLGPLELWSEVVHCVGDRVLFRVPTRSPVTGRLSALVLLAQLALVQSLQISSVWEDSS